MADSSSTLIKRVISALVGALIVLGLAYFGGKYGLYLVCTAAIILGVREYSQIAFRAFHAPKTITNLFWGTGVSFYALIMNFQDQGLLWFALVNAAFFVSVLWLTRNHIDNDDLLPTLAVGTFGTLFCVLFPYYAIEIVKLPKGEHWFLFMLLVVFSGDTAAYFGGRFFGKRKLMPLISPNKTWEGAAAGVLGSCLAGSLHLTLAMPEVPSYRIGLFCLVCGFTAQSGDLIMSLVKRVAHVKDSGGIMPGHGGILDRLDGILISCPLVYAFALNAVA
jgi:phosphatidate cytidylyltransferase